MKKIYTKEPEDGIWGYTLEVIPSSVFGATVMMPFTVEAPWTGDIQANGVRVTQPTLSPNEADYEIVQLKIKKVDDFTTLQANLMLLQGAIFDPSTNQLVVDINYGGGCFPHLFSLEWDGLTLESFPPQYNFNLVDLSDYDPCKAILPAQLRFDIDVPFVRCIPVEPISANMPLSWLDSTRYKKQHHAQTILPKHGVVP